ncbi:hypothetical protein O3Q52_32440 [Streptomyces sp. ActVer]|uniref:hypothetical protein n=1 Tax=Streptomyces sp. ActVer TaxID=3014558 RepID=UPI0022B31D41|nr:hypothetical protein [Streptomyces sp. ActVer]MCZ4512789.1 hypothetical protein [Streptomyces sp. ActVer]
MSASSWPVLRELPRRSYVITVKASASSSAIPAKYPASPPAPLISSSAGPSPRTSWYSPAPSTSNMPLRM